MTPWVSAIASLPLKRKRLIHATGPFGLPHHLVEKIILEPYDASWVLKYDVDAASVHVKTADANTMRFRDLFHAGALHIGDEIYHHGSYEMNGQRVELEKVARV